MRELLRNSSDILIAGEAADGIELIKQYFQLQPDIILIDIAMPGLSGIRALETIRKSDSNVKALFLSMYTEEIYYYQIYKSGGKGLLGKNIDLKQLLKAIKTVSRGKYYFGKNYSDKMLEELDLKYGHPAGEDEKLSRLSERETEILKLIAGGKSSQQIADQIFISRRTVDKHRANIIGKLGVSTLIDLYRFALLIEEKDAAREGKAEVSKKSFL